MKSRAGKGASQRQLRAGELLRHALADILMTEDIDEPVLSGEIVSVAEVRVSPDLKHASVFIGTMGPGDNKAVAAALNKHGRFLRGALARRIELKYVPELVFHGDEVAQAAARIDDLLRSPAVARDLK